MTMLELMEEAKEKLDEIRDGNHAVGQARWYDFIKGQGDFEGNGWDGRSEEQTAILDEVYEIVNKNVVYGTPPYSLESAEEIIDDILADLTILKNKLAYESANEV